MREDIYGGLKNAVERGVSLTQAAQSFINAGYSVAEVREAAKALDSNTLPLTNLPEKTQPIMPPIPQKVRSPLAIQQPGAMKPQVRPGMTVSEAKMPFSNSPKFIDDLSKSKPQPTTTTTPMKPLGSMPQTSSMEPVRDFARPHEAPSVLLIVLIAVLVLAVGFFIASLLFKEQIATFFSSLFG